MDGSTFLTANVCIRSHILNRHQPGPAFKPRSGTVVLSLGNGQRPVFGVECHDENSGLSFPPCFLGLLIFRPFLRWSQTAREYENEVDPEGGMRRRGQGTRTAPGARWVSIMLNRKWSPAIECLSAAAPRGAQWRWYKAPKV